MRSISRVQGIGRLVLLVLAVAMVGCQPRDPLEWKVDATTPLIFNRWSERTLPRVPREVADEFLRACAVIRGRTPQLRPAKDPFDLSDLHNLRNPLCLRIHQRTIRAVVLDGYRLANEKLQNTVANETDNILRTMERRQGVEASENAAALYDRIIENKRKVIANVQEQIAVNDERIAALSPKSNR